MKERDDKTEEKAPALSALGEEGLIQWLRAVAGSGEARVIQGIGDDAAVVAGSEKTLLTTDLLVEEVHFSLQLTPGRRLGRKALSVNLSDLAAMGGTPRFALLGIAVPPSFSVALLKEILSGFLEKGKEYGVTLVGGDVVRGEKLSLAVTVIGEAVPPAPVYRSGGRAGDLLFVSGYVGDSGLGLKRLHELSSPITEEKILADPLAGPMLHHLDPPARVSLGLRLAGLATAMMDLSDGLVVDLPRLLQESGGLGAEIELARLPLSPVFRNYFEREGKVSEEGWHLALAAGEDYELLFSVREEDEGRVQKVAGEVGVKLTQIGRLRQEKRLLLLDEFGRSVPLPRPGFNHFPEA